MEPEDVAKTVASGAMGKVAAVACGVPFGPVGIIAGAVIGAVINQMMNDDHDWGNSDNENR